MRPDFAKHIRARNKDVTVTDIQTSVGVIEVKSKKMNTRIDGGMFRGTFVPRYCSWLRWN